MLRIDIITIFPDIFKSVFCESIIKRAVKKRKVDLRVHDLRDHARDKRRTVDDRPFGGGPGMVMMPEPIFKAVKKIKGRRKAKIVLTAASGRSLTQKKCAQLAKVKNLIIICGHYEGVDERVDRYLADETISIGDYVLTGGEIPAMVLADAVIRLIPGVLGKESSLTDESFENKLLEYPQYTRPADFRGMKVPNVLLSGNHKQIKKWREDQAAAKTRKNRPDLFKK